MDPLIVQTEHRRLTILRHLERCPDYTSNSSILFDVCNGLGVASTMDLVVAALAWLEEQSLVRLEAHDSLTIVMATARGVEVARGAATHPGVKRPTART